MPKPKFELPPGRDTLLKAAMSRQERETRQRGLPAEYVDAVALITLQQGKCKCGCGQPLDLESTWVPKDPPPGYPVVAHEFFRRGKNTPGHVIGNVWWYRQECNAREAAPENRARGKSNRMGIELLKKDPKPDAEKPKPKYRWGSRKMQSRNTFQDHKR